MAGDMSKERSSLLKKLPRKKALLAITPILLRTWENKKSGGNLSVFQNFSCSANWMEGGNFCYIVLQTIDPDMLSMSVTDQVFRVSVRFTDVNFLQFASYIVSLSFLSSYSSAIKGFAIPTSHTESTKKTMKKALKLEKSRPENLKRLAFLE